jgi:hypothetical protein
VIGGVYLQKVLETNRPSVVHFDPWNTDALNGVLQKQSMRFYNESLAASFWG